jgi:diacylglycerol kinase family enzyme
MQVLYTAPTEGSAKHLAAESVSTSAVVIACGGDGTVHGVVQGLAHTGVPLGVLPLGTANALGRNLKLSLDPVTALERLLHDTPTLVPLGEITTSTGTRFFAVMAGCGPDGALVHALSNLGASRLKSRFGRSVYYAHAARLFATRRWSTFEVEFRGPGTSGWQRMSAAAMLASRIPDLGGLFSGLTARADLHAPLLHVKLLKPPAHLSFAAWFSLSRAGLPNPLLATIDVEEVRCSLTGSAHVHAQADAELAGCLPLRMRIVPAALSLLLPATQA